MRGRVLEPSPQTWTDIWALCRRDHGLMRAEFHRLTLAELEALEERRAIQIRHERFNAALIASTIYNCTPRGEGARTLSPFDFLPGFETDPEDERKESLRRSVKHGIALAFGQMKGVSRDKALAEKAKMITNMKANGFEDAEDIFREVFPEL